MNLYVEHISLWMVLREDSEVVYSSQEPMEALLMNKFRGYWQKLSKNIESCRILNSKISGKGIINDDFGWVGGWGGGI